MYRYNVEITIKSALTDHSIGNRIFNIVFDVESKEQAGKFCKQYVEEIIQDVKSTSSIEDSSRK